jgi:hypothetical protein
VDLEIQGSNDGINFTTIFSNNGSNVWSARDQVIRWDGDGADFDTPDSFTTIRFETTRTGLTGGARFQLNEFEIFGTVVPEPSHTLLCGLAGLALLRRRRK